MAKTLKEIVASNSRMHGDCRLWNGSLVRGRPSARQVINGKYVNTDIQRYLAIKKFDLDPNTQVSLRTTCGNPNCITKEHIEIVKREMKTRQLSSMQSVFNDMAANKTVFALAVAKGYKLIGKTLNISHTSVRTMLKNEAMLPFFQLKLQEHTGKTLTELRSADIDTVVANYKLSNFSREFIESGQMYNLHDEELYCRLLDECKVFKSHLVWVGETSHGTPVSTALDNYRRNALSLFMFAAFGFSVKGEYSVKCGFENCINPFHV